MELNRSAAVARPDDPKTKRNTLVLRYPLPIVDAHCHIFGQALFEGGDLVDWAGSSWLLWLFKEGAQRMAKYVGQTDEENGKVVLDGVPEIAWQNSYVKQTPQSRESAYARAAVTLLLDLGYTPLKIPIAIDATNSSQYTTEKQMIESQAGTSDNSGKLVLRIEILYCKEMEDYTGDDDIQIRISQNGSSVRTLPAADQQGGWYKVDYNGQTRMINEEIPIDPDGEVSIQLL